MALGKGSLSEALSESLPVVQLPCKALDAPVNDNAKSLTANTARLENGLRNALTAAERSGMQTHRIRGRVDMRSGGRIKSGEANVFKKRWTVAKHCTAVALVFDHSSSMNRRVGLMPDGAVLRRHETAKALEIAAGRTLARAQVPFSIIKYTDGIYIAKTAQQRFTPAQLAANAHGQFVTGLTDTTAAILAAEESLRGVDATRKMILVITDGGCNRGAVAVSESCDYVRARGIDQVNCLVIGPYVEPLGYDHAVEITAESLPREGLKMLSQ